MDFSKPLQISGKQPYSVAISEINYIYYEVMSLEKTNKSFKRLNF